MSVPVSTTTAGVTAGPGPVMPPYTGLSSNNYEDFLHLHHTKMGTLLNADPLLGGPPTTDNSSLFAHGKALSFIQSHLFKRHSKLLNCQNKRSSQVLRCCWNLHGQLRNGHTVAGTLDYSNCTSSWPSPHGDHQARPRLHGRRAWIGNDAEPGHLHHFVTVATSPSAGLATNSIFFCFLLVKYP